MSKRKVSITITPDDKGYVLFILSKSIDCWTITQEELNKLARLCDNYRTDKIHTYEIPKL